MTALTLTTDAAPRSFIQRIANVVRLHLANPFTILLTPLMVIGIIFLANWVIWALIRAVAPSDPESVADVSQGLQYSGASLWTFVFMMVVAIQAMNLSFPFALGFGSTRRDFSLGTAVTFIGLSAFFALVYGILAAIEFWTNGWGLGGQMFNSFWFGPGEPWGVRLFNMFAGFLFFSFIGTVFGAIYVRYRARGLILFFLALGVVLIGLAALFTLTGGWGAFGAFFARVGFTGGFALSLIVTAAAGVAGALVLQRATPRS